MMYGFSKYHGAGNDFLIADNRDGHLSLSPTMIRHLCDRHVGSGADGVMLLENSDLADFRMVFHNPDGSGGMMCGNGGRCIVSFAADLGISKDDGHIVFEAADGLHHAEIITSSGPTTPERVVRLQMRDVSGIQSFPKEHVCFLDTGTRHLVKFVHGLSEYPVQSDGAALRHDPHFAPVGTNVNFVEPERKGDRVILNIRTFEKGVEGETLACGTGIVASALAAYSQGVIGSNGTDDRVSCIVRAAIADLIVDFVPIFENGKASFEDIWLTGPTNYVGTIEIML